MKGPFKNTKISVVSSLLVVWLQKEPKGVEVEILKYFRNSRALPRSFFMLICTEVPTFQASYADFNRLYLVSKIIYEVTPLTPIFRVNKHGKSPKRVILQALLLQCLINVDMHSLKRKCIHQARFLLFKNSKRSYQFPSNLQFRIYSYNFLLGKIIGRRRETLKIQTTTISNKFFTTVGYFN